MKALLFDYIDKNDKDIDWQARSKKNRNLMMARFGVESVYDNELLLCLAYTMDAAGFTEHGSSIGGAWISEEGEMFLWLLERDEELMEEKGMSRDLAEMTVYGGGLKIYTTQDTAMQKILEEENCYALGVAGYINKYFGVYCPRCGKELVNSNSFVEDRDGIVKYECDRCGIVSFWDFAHYPFPVLKTCAKDCTHSYIDKFGYCYCDYEDECDPDTMVKFEQKWKGKED